MFRPGDVFNDGHSQTAMYSTIHIQHLNVENNTFSKQHALFNTLLFMWLTNIGAMVVAVHSTGRTHPLVGAPTASRGPTAPAKKRKL